MTVTVRFMGDGHLKASKPHTVKCPHCESVLEFIPETDARPDTRRFGDGSLKVECPICGYLVSTQVAKLVS